MYKYIAHQQIGYFGKDTAMSVDAPLGGHESAQAGVIFKPNGEIHLYSYATHVCTIKGDLVYCFFNGTRTTIKHIGWFMREYAKSYYHFAKMSADTGKWVNFKTGELMDELQ